MPRIDPLLLFKLQTICFFNQFMFLQVYKSASKRKAHILKNHPGAELPPSIRKLRPAAPGEPDPMLSTHTQLTGTIATAPVCCPHCAKQYSSKVSGTLLKQGISSFRSIGFVVMICIKKTVLTVFLFLRPRWCSTSEKNIQSSPSWPTPSRLL